MKRKECALAGKKIQKVRLILTGILFVSSMLWNNKGICQSIDDSEAVNFTEIKLKCRNIHDDTYVIRSQAELKEQIDKREDVGACIQYKFPEIDFEKDVLFGYDFHVGGCDIPTYQPEVFSHGDTTVVKLEIVQNGKCLAGRLITFWCLVDKEDIQDHIMFINTIRVR